jgi:nitrate reductase alpha subunit
MHDSPGELAQPNGRVRDWKKGEIEPVPGRTMPSMLVVERDYPLTYQKMIALGPVVKEKGVGGKGISWPADEEYKELKKMLGTIKTDGPAKGYPSLVDAQNVADAILMLSATTNGRMAVRGWRALEKRTGLELVDLAKGREEEKMAFRDLDKPRKVITAPIWSGIERGNRFYSPFTVNVERKVPWRTLTGRQQFYLDHEWLLDFGEGLPLYRPPLDILRYEGLPETGEEGSLEVTVRYLTPHYKWSIHSTFGDVPHMLTLFRGGPTVWLNKDDAAEAGIEDNDWIEGINKNGVVVARAVVTHRIPRGIAFMHHSQERRINVPVSMTTRDRGGTHNSPTRIYVKPTHMVGGYAQLSWGFNYYGPTGNQRDGVVVIRKIKEVNWYED